MRSEGEVTLERDGHQYGATYSVARGMLHVKTHTETRTVELSNRDPSTLAIEVLAEILESHSPRQKPI